MPFDPDLVAIISQLAANEAAKEVVKGASGGATKSLLDRGSTWVQRLVATWKAAPASKAQEGASEEPEPNLESSRTSAILIIGAGGVGKSTLGKILAWKLDAVVSRQAGYVESRNVEELTLGDDPNVSVVILPGQRHRRETWASVLNEISTGEFGGVVLVGAFGFHTLGNDYQAHALFAKYKGNTTVFVREYLKLCRKDELAVLDRLIPALASNQRKQWLLSVVVKQDLWWEQRADAEAFYRDGPYNAAVSKLVQGKSASLFRHEIEYVSLTINNFRSQGEVLRNTAAGYDQPMQIESVYSLFQCLGSLRDWEAGNA